MSCFCTSTVFVLNPDTAVNSPQNCNISYSYNNVNSFQTSDWLLGPGQGLVGSRPAPPVHRLSVLIFLFERLILRAPKLTHVR